MTAEGRVPLRAPDRASTAKNEDKRPQASPRLLASLSPMKISLEDGRNSAGWYIYSMMHCLCSFPLIVITVDLNRLSSVSPFLLLESLSR